MRLGRWTVLAVGVAAAACAPTIGPVLPSVQVLVVLDSTDDLLRIIPVDTPEVVHTISLGVASFDKHALALNHQLAAIGLEHTVMLLDLASKRRLCPSQTLEAGGVIASLAFADNGFAYAAVPLVNGTPHFDPVLCGVGTGYVRGGPRAFVSARSTLFVVTGNNEGFPSWLAASTGQSADNTPLPLADSILLSAPGHAQGAVLGSDGFLYVINAGTGAPNARLSQVNPISRTELSVVPGFGTTPQFIATDGADRIFVASAAEGLMVYNIRTNHVDRSATSAVLLGGAPRGLAADDVGRVYALIAGSCSTAAPGALGRVQVFGSDLVNTRSVAVGRCPVALGVTDIPATLYHFDP